MMCSKRYLKGMVVLFCLLCCSVEARIQRTSYPQDGKVEQRKLEIEEYPVQMEPFHIVYHHNPNRDQNFDGMEEMDVLAATRSYLVSVLDKAQPNNQFKRLLLYLFIREEDETMTKVAYSGTAFFSMPTSPSMRLRIQQESWRSFLGENKTEYLLDLMQYGILGIDSITLQNAGGNLVGINPLTGELMAISAAPIADASSTEAARPNTDMSSDLTFTIYLCAIIIPLLVFFMTITWWFIRKIQHDVEWKQPHEMDPEGTVWQSSQRLEQVLVRPLSTPCSTTETFVTGLTHHEPLPTNIVIVSEEESKGRFVKEPTLVPVGETQSEATPPENGVPTILVVENDAATTSTLGTCTTDHIRKNESNDATEGERFLEPTGSKRSFVVSKPRNPIERTSPNADLSKNYTTEKKDSGKIKEKRRKSKSAAKTRTKQEQRSTTSNSTQSSDVDKKKSRQRVNGSSTPVSKATQGLRSGLPPTPQKREPSTRRTSTRGRSSKKMDPQAIKTITAGVLGSEGAVLKDPPGSKPITFDRKRPAARSILAGQKADASGTTSTSNGTPSSNKDKRKPRQRLSDEVQTT